MMDGSGLLKSDDCSSEYYRTCKYDCGMGTTTTTTAAAASCAGSFTASYSSQWATGANLEVEVTVPNDVEGWSITVTFDKSVTSFSVNNGHNEQIQNGNQCKFTDAGWNEEKDQGQKLSFQFNLGFASAPSPLITQLTLKDDDWSNAKVICGSKHWAYLLPT